MLDALAEKYGVLPFAPELLRSVSNPYQRAFLLAGIGKSRFSELFGTYYPKYFKTLFDVHGTSLMNLISSAFGGEPIKTLFPENEIEQRPVITDIFTTKDGKQVILESRF